MIIQVRFWRARCIRILGIVRFENKQTAQGGQGADPDVESGFKELIKC
jgi:hypothetical protein